MANEITVNVQQISAAATEGSVRGHKVVIDRPEAKGGTDQGAMGGELLLVALGGCFMSNLLAAIRARQVVVSNINVDITATMDGTPTRFTAIRLNISADYDDKDLMTKLVTISERGCLVANSLKGAIDLSFSIK